MLRQGAQDGPLEPAGGSETEPTDHSGVLIPALSSLPDPSLGHPLALRMKGLLLESYTTEKQGQHGIWASSGFASGEAGLGLLECPSV